MRKLILVPLLAAAPAAAQPVTQPSACQVTISRAPDDVRDAIEAWVAAEPRCATTLDVRVVATDGGYYLFARDEAGRVRERVVPDAQSAGVLVASWVADDLIERHAPDEPPPPAPAPPTPAPPRPAAALAPPSTFAPTPMPNVDKPPAPARREPHGRWLSLGGTIDSWINRAGVRAEAEVVRRGPWTLGAVLARSGVLMHPELMSPTGYAYGYIDATDTRLFATVDFTAQLGRRWELRLAVGGGVMHTAAEGRFDDSSLEAAGWFPGGEASIMLAARVFTDWAIMVGPIATFNAQTFMLEGTSGTYEYGRDEVEWSGFAGLRRRL